MLTSLVNKIVQYNNPGINCQLQLAQKFSQLSEKRKNIVTDILGLYQCKPEEKFFDLYHPDAVFEDPICNAKNRQEIRSQFMMMPIVFPRSITSQVNVIHSDEHEIVLDLFQWYHTVLVGIPIPVRSLVRLVFDSDDLIIYHGDYWYHTAAFDKVSGLLGFTWKSLRRLNGASMTYVEAYINQSTEKLPDNFESGQ